MPPSIDYFDGIKISIYSNDHNKPHFHAEFGEYEVIINIETLEIEKGEIPPKQYKKVQEWAIDKKEYLLKTFQKLNPHLR